MPADRRPIHRYLWGLACYGTMIAAAVGLFFVVRHWGADLAAPPAASSEPATAAYSATSHVLLHLLLVLAAVIVVGQILGRLFVYLGQPPVIGEVLAGICLGPSLLGRLSPEAGAFLLPAAVAPSLSVVAQLGVILYMFLVGLELNAGNLRKQGHVALAISHASIIAPFVLGALLALWLYPRFSNQGVEFTAFALFISVSMSITAFPVLARILTDRRLSKTDLGTMALACAATDDVTAWCLLALVVGVAQAQIGQALVTAALSICFVAFVLLVVRPLVNRALAGREGEPPARGILALVLVGMLLSSATSEAIGLHAIFGAFLLGAVIPHDSAIARQLTRQLQDLITILLLPAYFAFTGMRTQIGLVSGAEQWLACGLIIVVATLGKFGGTLTAARVMGLDWRSGASLGILMNTRGLMELIVLNVGLDLGVISPTLFAMMVLMAIVTTMATSPILNLLMPSVAARSSSADDDVPRMVGAG